MTSDTPNFIVQEGPEKGREIVIPPDGARIGRATENDIRLADAAMSRFQCRMYYRDGFLHIMDLGSTNESLVNNQPVTDQILRYGDEVLIGESILKVINDGMGGERPSESSPPSDGLDPAPIVFSPDEEQSPPAPVQNEPPPAKIEVADEPAPPPSPEPVSALVEDVDLGFGRREELVDSHQEKEKRALMPLILVTLVTTLVVFSVGIIVLMNTQPPPPTNVENPRQVQIAYERVIAEDGNIFRYALYLNPEGLLSAEIHDIREDRSISRDQQVEEATLKEFINQLENQKSSFLQLEDTYRRENPDGLRSSDLTLIFGREAKRVRTINQPPPDAFNSIQELIEGFARNQLGLSTLNKPPAELRAEAEDAWRNAQRLFSKREVKNDNLYQAIQKLREIKFLLQDIEPKPDYYDQALELEREWSADLDALIEDYFFEANRSLKIGRADQATAYMRRIMETIPERSNRNFIDAKNNLIRLEQELNR
jgi:hypothetical protein